MTWNNWEIIEEVQNFIFRWRSCCRRRCPCLGSLLLANMHTFQENERFVSKETVVVHEQECEALKFHSKQVDKG